MDHIKNMEQIYKWTPTYFEEFDCNWVFHGGGATVEYSISSKKAIRFSTLKYMDQEWMVNIPLYAISTLQE